MVTLNILIFFYHQRNQTRKWNLYVVYFNQRLECAAPKCWSKYTTLSINSLVNTHFCLTLGRGPFWVKLAWHSDSLKYKYTFFHLPPEFLPVLGLLTPWCASTLGAAVLCSYCSVMWPCHTDHCLSCCKNEYLQSNILCI